MCFFQNCTGGTYTKNGRAQIFSQFGMPNRFSPHRSNSPHGSANPKIQWASSDPTAKPAYSITKELESGCQRATWAPGQQGSP
ncbi:UNVERIFIED_CONTAM: hypothetical protein FKN15_022950 [Acipenser sinensis]